MTTSIQHDRLLNSIDAALKFLKDSRNRDGFWSDFLTLAGESTYWVTGYVGYALTISKELIETKLLQEAKDALLSNQHATGGWSYGRFVPPDADSTSWCLLFLSAVGGLDRQNVEKSLGFLLQHQSREDGGFRTYAAPRDVARFMGVDGSVSFDGWSSSQVCVTAAAARALMANGSKEGVEESLEYIRKSQIEEGYWNSYWWSGKLYATANCLEALQTREEKSDELRFVAAKKWIASTQLSDGGWSDASMQGAGWAFSTALAIKGLLAHPGSIYSNSVNAGIAWILANQLSDGSWMANHILRIPHPAVKSPWSQPLWKEDGKAINAAIKDQHRLFTTATVYSALCKFKKTIEK